MLLNGLLSTSLADDYAHHLSIHVEPQDQFFDILRITLTTNLIHTLPIYKYTTIELTHLDAHQLNIQQYFGYTQLAKE